MTRRAAKGKPAFCVWLNVIVVPPASGAGVGLLACGRATRNVSAEAVLEAASATTAAARSGRGLLMVTAARRPGASADRRSFPSLPPLPATALQPRMLAGGKEQMQAAHRPAA